MKLDYQGNRSKTDKEVDGKKNRFLNSTGMKAAAVVAAFLGVMPLAERTARAQETAVAASAEVTSESLRAKNSDLLINLQGLALMGPDKKTKAEAKKLLKALDKQIDAKKIDESKLNGALRDAQVFVDEKMPPVEELAPEPAPVPEPVAAPVEANAGVEVDAGVPAETPTPKQPENVPPEVKEVPAPQVQGNKPVFSTNFLFSIEKTKDTEYTDPALSPFSTNVDISGKKRGMNLKNSFDIGGNLVGNEAGTAFFLGAKYRDLATLDAGNIWFGEQAVPFGRILFRPELNFYGAKLVYYGSVAFAGNMPSWVYSSHSVGLGYSQPMGDNFRLRLGGVIGGALSHPAWDDVYLNFTAGVSGEISKTVLLYIMPTFYFAAKDPMKTAYAGYYRPKIQDIEAGVQVTIKQWTGRLYGNFGLIGDHYGIYDRYGARLTRTVNISKEADIDIWGSLGITRWAPDLGGRIDPAVMVGATVVIGGKYVNSTNTLNYSHLQDGGVRFAKTDFPTKENPGPYGFGKSGDPTYDVPINEAKQRIMNSATFEEFAGSYSGATQEEVIIRARFIGAFMQQVAYANNAYNSLTTGSVLDSEVQRIAGASDEDMFMFLKEYVQWYKTHSSSEPLPDRLKNGIAVCAGIHWLMAEFLRTNGVDAIAMSVNTPDGPHVITAAQLKDRTLLLDYGNMYETPDGTLDQTLRFYGQNRQAPTFQSQMFGSDGYMGTYVTSEGRLLHETIGIENTEVLKKDFLGVR